MPFLSCPGPLLTAAYPIDENLLAERHMLLGNATFMKLLNSSDLASVVLSAGHQVVLANQAMLRRLGQASDASLIGSVPGDLFPCPGCSDLKARTRNIEVQGRAFFIMSLECSGDTTEHPLQPELV